MGTNGQFPLVWGFVGGLLCSYARKEKICFKKTGRGEGVGNSVFLGFFLGEFFFVAKVAVIPNEHLAKPWPAGRL